VVEFVPIEGVTYRHDYPAIFNRVADGKLPAEETYRELCKTDLFFLLYFGLERVDVNRPFLIKAIREVEDNHDGTLDLWAREHYKSTILTYGLPLQELIRDPEERIAIFSHTRPIAKGFLRQIKQTLEGECPLKRWFPDVFYRIPRREAPKWSEDDGLVVKRKTRPKESSIEAWGLVDGQPISKHFTIRIYDDCVTRESVTTPEMIAKTLEAYELSHSLGTDGGQKRVCGTHYHFNDLYTTLKTKADYLVRLKPATDNGEPHGTPVLLSVKRLRELRKEQGIYVFSCQQLLNPTEDGSQQFKLSWIKNYHKLPPRLNKYMLCDPANEKKEDSDYTTIGVIGLDSDSNHFLLDLVRDRLNLGERWKAIKRLWRKHSDIKMLGYEKYGMQADLWYFEERQRKEGFYFPIVSLGGATRKADRIKRLIPIFENGRFYLPYRLIYINQADKSEVDLVRVFIDEEYHSFPFSAHDDMLDMLSRICDPDLMAMPPLPIPQQRSIERAREAYLYNDQFI